MDYNNNEIPPVNNQANNNFYSNNQPNGMATAALVLGILAIVSLCCIYGSYIFGGIAITLGLLSRGKDKKLSTNALIGVILSIVGMVISTVIITLYVIFFMTSGAIDTYMQEYETIYEDIYGEEFPFDSDTFNYDNDTQPEETELPNTLTITLN
jgi:hypothetical protein